MTRHTFFAIDGHTAGNPVRLVAGGTPLLRGNSMSERRADFMARFDWIRTGLCFEPRGHDMMSGGFLYPPTQADCDFGILFIETSGCLPMCGHGTIGMVTFGLEHGLITPRTPGELRVEVPAGIIDIRYTTDGDKVTSVRIRNIASYLAAHGLVVEVEGLGPLTLDVAYGGNYYAIVEPQAGYAGIDALGAARILELSPRVRDAVRAVFHPVHPEDASINGVSHVQWADVAKGSGANAPDEKAADGRNAVFYGDRAIDRSPCGTGTSARLAQLAATGRLKVGAAYVHESIIGSRFTGRVEAATRVGDFDAIIPSIEGSAWTTGFNTLWIDSAAPFAKGFQLV